MVPSPRADWRLSLWAESGADLPCEVEPHPGGAGVQPAVDSRKEGLKHSGEIFGRDADAVVFHLQEEPAFAPGEAEEHPAILLGAGGVLGPRC